MPESFTQIVTRIGRTDKLTGHSYCPYYDTWLPRLRETATDVLEIGVCWFGGGSVLALAEYFPNATIWAIDNDRRECCPEVFEHPRIRFVHGNAFLPEILTKLYPVYFDLIIDDVGIHETKDQVQVLDLFLPMLKQTGIYVIEDCTTREWFPRLPGLRDQGWRTTIVDMASNQVEKNTLIKLERA